MAEIRNPNQGGGGKQDSRSFLVFSLVFLVMFLGMKFFAPKRTPTPEKQPAPARAASLPATAAPVPAVPAPGATPPAVASTQQAQHEETTTIENELYRIVFTNRGGQVRSWVLKKYKDSDGKPLDLVNGAAAAKFGFPLSLYTYDAGLRTKLTNALWVPSETGAQGVPSELTYSFAEGGLVAKKSFRFDSSYVLHVTAEVMNGGVAVPALVAWPAGLGDQSTLPEFASSQLDVSQSGKFDHIAPKKVTSGQTQNGPFDYAGLSDQYFGAIFLPGAPDNSTMVGLRNQITVARDPKKPEGASDTASVLGAAVGAVNGPTSLRIFAGPKVIEVLNSVRATALNGTPTGPTIEPILNFGWTGVVAKPLFVVLRFTYDHIVHNWGWAILLLTLVINLAMLPTRVQMMKSSIKMQRIQPEMQVIKDKYKKYKATDPRRQEMNKEVMALQQREGVNMFGGCLPMLIQYPLLFGFYRMLQNVIELRQAHWFWLHDLAAPDPLHILPIIVIVSMFTVQYLSPSPGMDPAQQKMMAFMMPVFFGFMMWNFAAGISLYWAAGNLINTATQMVMNRTGMGKQMREIAAKRAQKKLGKPAVARR